MPARDAAALARLRAVMLSDMGLLAAGAEPGWQDKAEAWFAQRLHGESDFAAFVVQEQHLGVVSCAAGACDRHARGRATPAACRASSST